MNKFKRLERIENKLDQLGVNESWLTAVLMKRIKGKQHYQVTKNGTEVWLRKKEAMKLIQEESDRVYHPGMLLFVPEKDKVGSGVLAK